MDSLVVADTFGVMNPQAYEYFISRIKKKTKKPIEIHAHNDFGLGVANTITALASGADVAHVTVNGIGERSGNASLEEVAAALKMMYGVKIDLKFEKFRGLSKLVQELSDVTVPPQKPIVGDGLFTTESGIIAGWWNKLEAEGKPLEMFPFLPETVGHTPVQVILGKKSGKDSIVYKAKKLNLTIDEKQIDTILLRVKEEAISKKRTLTDEEFIDIAKKYS
jgi:isopropylmalate/homocitrate/citramalate synthase